MNSVLTTKISLWRVAKVHQENRETKKATWGTLLYMEAGSGVLRYDSDEIPFTKYALFYIPASYPYSMDGNFDYTMICFDLFDQDTVELAKTPLYWEKEDILQSTIHRLASDYYERGTFSYLQISYLYLLLSRLSLLDEELSFSTALSKKEAHKEELKKYIELHYREEIKLNEMAIKLGLSPNYLSTLFRKEGLTPKKYWIQIRMKKALELLRRNDMKIAEVANYVGYQNPLYFSSEFKRYYGVSPKDYSKITIE